MSRLYKIAVILHTLVSLFAVLVSVPALLQGPGSQTITEGVPQFVIVISALLGMAGLVSAYGAWEAQTWGIALTIVVEAIDGLFALPGVLFAPSPFARVSAIIGVLVGVFVIYVMLQAQSAIRAARREE